MANVHHSKEELVDYLVEMLSHEHIREYLRKKIIKEDTEVILYFLDNFVDENNNNVKK